MHDCTEQMWCADVTSSDEGQAITRVLGGHGMAKKMESLMNAADDQGSSEHIISSTDTSQTSPTSAILVFS